VDHSEVLLQGLQQKLSTHLGSIKRATGAITSLIEPAANGEFVVRVAWLVDGAVEIYEKAFAKSFVFRNCMSKPQLEWHIEKRACDYARDIMREVLAQRGIV
jgi:hypothetical protein